MGSLRVKLKLTVTVRPGSKVKYNEGKYKLTNYIDKNLSSEYHYPPFEHPGPAQKSQQISCARQESPCACVMKAAVFAVLFFCVCFSSSFKTYPYKDRPSQQKSHHQVATL